MECYLDNAATTRPLSEVCDFVSRTMYENYGNPSSLHMRGFEAEKIVRDSAQKIAKTLKCDPGQIVFTSGGTESNNMALFGVAAANQRAGKHIITTCIEHASVHQPLMRLESMGFEVSYLPVDEKGHLDGKTLRDALRPDTILVSVMMVNNEVGSVLDVAELSQIVKEYSSRIVFHVDAIQAYGKMKIIPKKSGIDLMSVSAHKIHGPKGVGFLYQAKGIKMLPYVCGGGQQGKMRSGTENVPGIAGLGMAAERMNETLEERRAYLYELKRHFIERVLLIGGATVNACDLDAVEDTAPHIVSVSFEGVRSEVLLHALEEKKIYVSSGSACSSNYPGISGTLKAIGVPERHLDSTLRFSFSDMNRREEIDYAADCLEELVQVLARYRQR